jgi:putative ABC transport system permease protein
MVTQAADGSIANDLFTVKGLLGTDEDPASRDCVLTLESAQRFLVLPGRFHEVVVLGVKLTGARALARKIGQTLGNGYEAAPWQVVEREFYRAMTVDRQGMWVMLLVIMVLVALGVLNTVLMNVLERTREYGLLKALGLRPGGVFSLIVAEMGLLSLYALVPGVLLGWAANAYFIHVGLRIPEPISYGGVVFERMTGSYDWMVFFLPAVVTVGTAVLVSLIPAFRARSLTPVEALRDV